MQFTQADPVDLEALPQEFRDQYPQIVEDLRTGVLDEIPDNIFDQLSASVADRIPDSLVANSIDPTFALVLGAIAIVSFIGFGYGVAKAATKAAIFFLLLGAAAGAVLYYQI